MRTREEYLKEYDSYSEDYCFRGLQDLFWELLAALAEKEEIIELAKMEAEELRMLGMDMKKQIAALTARLRIEEPHPFGEGYDALDLAIDRIKALTARIKELDGKIDRLTCIAYEAEEYVNAQVMLRILTV
jgi:hypothetical protein